MLLFATLVVPQVADARQKIAPAFDEEATASIRSNRPVDLIVVFDDEAVQQEIGRVKAERLFPPGRAALQAHKSRAFAALKGDFAKRYSANEVQFAKDYSHLPIALLRVSSEPALRRLLDDPMVRGISKNEILQRQLVQSLPLIHQPAVANGDLRGQGTTVVVLDTGIDYTRPEFGSCTSPGAPSECRVVYAADIAPNDGQLDDNGHGTNVSAIVAAVAPGARIAVLDVFAGEYCYSDKAIAGINWAIANQATYNIVAINMSMGGELLYSSPISDPADATKSAIDNARTAGILTVAASGNSGSSTGLSFPAAVDTAISVGAVYDSAFGDSLDWAACGSESTAPDKVACFSNSASYLTMLAPGAMINAGGYSMGGTSQAAPHVAGGVAVLRAAFPADTLDETVARLRNGIPVTDPRNGLAKPRLDLEAAGILTPAEAIPPEVIATFPVPGAPDASATTAVMVTFSGAVDPLTITPSTFVLSLNRTSTPVEATVSYNDATKTATLHPITLPLVLNETYTASLVGGASGVKDLAGNALATDVVWSFTTALVDTTPPTVSNISPANLAAGVSTAAAVTATFSEQVDAGTIGTETFLLRDMLNNPVPATVSYNAPTLTATLTPTVPLNFLMTYTATLTGGASGIRDLAGNVLAADFPWGFTTAQSAVLPPDTTVFAAILPASRSAVVGSPVTVLGTIINAGASPAAGCGVALPPGAPAGLSFGYRTTNTATNLVIGLPNTPVNLAPGASQSFVLAYIPSAPFDPVDLPVMFDCENSSPAGVLLGVNTLLLSASPTPVPDVIALAATLTNDGIVNIPGASGTGVFAVASVNMGAGSAITVAADTGSASLPVTLTLCETDPGSGQCLQPPAASVATTIANGATPTFAIFVRGNGSAVAFNPAVNRVFMRFRESGITGTVRGATSVAVRTQ